MLLTDVDSVETVVAIERTPFMLDKTEAVDVLAARMEGYISDIKEDIIQKTKMVEYYRKELDKMQLVFQRLLEVEEDRKKSKGNKEDEEEEVRTQERLSLQEFGTLPLAGNSSE